MHAMAWGSIVVAVIAAAGAIIAWRYLPARATSPSGTEPFEVGEVLA
jgi:hypothetical protein